MVTLDRKAAPVAYKYSANEHHGPLLSSYPASLHPAEALVLNTVYNPMMKLPLVALIGAALQVSAQVNEQGLDAWHWDNLYTLAVQELDPIISPNAQSSHMHRILGGNNFAAAYNSEELSASSCTTAGITVDHSSYWAPQLYWIVDPENPDTTGFLQLSSFNRFYYFLGRSDPSVPVQAWPEGFKMVAGDPNKKTASPIYFYECHRKADLTDSFDADNFNFDDPCIGGIKFDLHFPSCWDGVNLYKSDQSHMAYPTLSVRDGPCPASHPIRLPTILLEYTYHPEKYPSITKGQNMKGHLTWANGDMTGYGLHGDFLMGWDREILTKALTDPGCVGQGHAITIQSCPVFAPYFNGNGGFACKPSRGELLEPYAQGDGNIVPKLPGCNLLWGATGSKPTCSTPVPGLDISAFKATAGPDILPASQQYDYSLPESEGWHNIGCYGNKALSGSVAYIDAKLTPERCQETCKKNGYSYAAVSSTGGFRCLCDNTFNMNAGIMLSGCAVACPAGNATCGGENKLDTYYQAPQYVTAGNDRSDLGCYKLLADWASDNFIKGASYTFTSKSMTRGLCSSTCVQKDAAYSAVRDTSCYCGPNLTPGPGFYAPAEMCTRPCGGNSTEICGDYYSISVTNLRYVEGIETTKPIATVSATSSASSVRPTPSDVLSVTVVPTASTSSSVVSTTTAASSQVTSSTIASGSTTSTTSASASATSAAPFSTAVYRGCVADGTNRVLNSTGTSSRMQMTVALCANTARQAGKKLFGVEYGTDCYIGDSLLAANSSSACTIPCSGDNSTVCGGVWSMSLYELLSPGDAPSITVLPTASASSSVVSTTTAASSRATSSTIASGSTSSTQTSSATSATSPAPSSTAVYRGCIADGATRVLNSTGTSSRMQMTIALCANTARQAGKKLFGVEYGTDCYIGDSLLSANSSSACTAPCSGDNSTLCGGPWSMSLYELLAPGKAPSVTVVPSATSSPVSSTTPATSSRVSTSVKPTTSTTSSVVSTPPSVSSRVTSATVASGSTTSTTSAAPSATTSVAFSPYVYQGCIADSSVRVLNSTGTSSRMQMTIALCANTARQAGKKLFGLEYGTDCYIGDSLLANVTSTGCTIPCSGDNSTLCGGPWRLSLYALKNETMTELPTHEKRFVKINRRRLGE